MKVRKQLKKFTATFLTLALLFTMLPTIALAEDAELIKFKNMEMEVLRNNDVVSLYDYISMTAWARWWRPLMLWAPQRSLSTTLWATW